MLDSPCKCFFDILGIADRLDANGHCFPRNVRAREFQFRFQLQCGFGPWDIPNVSCSGTRNVVFPKSGRCKLCVLQGRMAAKPPWKCPQRRNVRSGSISSSITIPQTIIRHAEVGNVQILIFILVSVSQFFKRLKCCQLLHPLARGINHLPFFIKKQTQDFRA